MSAKKFIVVHHTGRKNSTVESIRAYHTKHKGWSDIGYHSIIYKDGTIHKGRDESQPGAHAANSARSGSIIENFMKGKKSANSCSLGVTMVGNFDIETPTSKQLAGLVAQLTKWCITYQIDPAYIVGHRDLNTLKSCPGHHLYGLLPRIISNVQVSYSGGQTLYSFS